ncbi:ABC transporter substrate-binding protein [Streptomyces sp. SID13666]|uniref:ABC transporter substrate-binding protein n=1 Tax=unclassified Streptomyces TaxID=2593676 RepID=UPI0013C1D263|nr:MULTISPECIES: ABC transporter substrate-binding protein [unclassified Streptomyces]NEA54249.1 ABC transporter substrate-binding protein [Streptomyces sp. SID13666]NEA70344.1 ABC transporter substrate-binding protein [Streptomyces sp. SID13588]
MRTMSRALCAAIAASTSLAVLSACSSAGGNTGTQHGKAPAIKAGQSAVRMGTEAESHGPAPVISGAGRGGTVTVLDTADYDHLDPQKVYVSQGYDVLNMVDRQLTGYTVINGQRVLVGDLATNTGQASDQGRTWTFHLKSGATWQDGQAVTAQQVRYGIERSFQKGFENGPVYWQEWLTGTSTITDAQKKYAGPATGDMPAIVTPDASTIVFHFPKPQSDVPFAAALGTASPVRKDKDTGSAYDLSPYSCGPYQIAAHTQNVSMKLVPNLHWKADTDPIRYQYADAYEFGFGKELVNIDQQMLSTAGNGPTTMSLSNAIAPSLNDTVNNRADRGSIAYQPQGIFGYWFAINTARITDVNLRTALLYAFPKEQLRQLQGGAFAGQYGTTVTTPDLLGYRDYDTFHAPARGDVATAQKYLARSAQKLSTLVYAYRSGDGAGQQQVQVLASAYAKIGIHVVAKPLDATTYYDTIGAKGAPYDMFLTGWGADWPSPSTVLPNVFDARQGPWYDSSRFDSSADTAEFDRIAALSDASAKAAAYIALEKKIMAGVPVIPYLYSQGYQIHGVNLRLPRAANGNPLNGAHVA